MTPERQFHAPCPHGCTGPFCKQCYEESPYATIEKLGAELDAARAREQALAETFNERVNWIQVVEARWRSAEAREAKLREKAQVVCNFTGDDGSTEYFVEWLRAMNDLRAALTEGVIVS